MQQCKHHLLEFPCRVTTHIQAQPSNHPTKIWWPNSSLKTYFLGCIATPCAFLCTTHQQIACQPSNWPTSSHFSHDSKLPIAIDQSFPDAFWWLQFCCSWHLAAQIIPLCLFTIYVGKPPALSLWHATRHTHTVHPIRSVLLQQTYAGPQGPGLSHSTTKQALCTWSYNAQLANLPRTSQSWHMTLQLHQLRTATSP